MTSRPDAYAYWVVCALVGVGFVLALVKFVERLAEVY